MDRFLARRYSDDFSRMPAAPHAKNPLDRPVRIDGKQATWHATVFRRRLASCSRAPSARGAARPRLQAPRWPVWAARDGVGLRQAALLTMGITPMAGIIGLLNGKPKRLAEVRKRLHAFETEYGRSAWLPRGSGLPKTVRLPEILATTKDASCAKAIASCDPESLPAKTLQSCFQQR
ncbi:hypothetical protein [Variovorax sp. MHTC-1]|uniref:hypothetical protein n=1 Tax=Variovorax sp. MHTC-1 TaxID=2495593 RepID=UPI000F85C3B8|nr:hypothetical protein [Variovorax sp. MHTC-1]RST51862.1 hypothetical protein EJI01_18295 [Variovorax sp. MHTC-1]